MRPKWVIASTATRCMSSRLPTSAVTAMASQPFPCARRDAISFSVSVLRAARTSLAPWRAAASAVASPMPLDAPVITMTCSESGLCLLSAMCGSPSKGRMRPEAANHIPVEATGCNASQADLAGEGLEVFLALGAQHDDGGAALVAESVGGGAVDRVAMLLVGSQPAGRRVVGTEELLERVPQDQGADAHALLHDGELHTLNHGTQTHCFTCTEKNGREQPHERVGMQIDTPQEASRPGGGVPGARAIPGPSVGRIRQRYSGSASSESHFCARA